MSGCESDAIVSFYTGNGPPCISDSSVNEQSFTYISRGDLHNSAPPLPHRPVENQYEELNIQYPGIIEVGPKRQIPVWQCCSCGQSGMPIRAGSCQYCGTPRCAYCPVTKVKIRPHEACPP
ncbi:hypothetical protein CCHR01_08719 [Colletotrichum chrysophilum]|uniref:Uncharacterized protein n=1 Tax=Colletotrichum chrysophilum TaxID=1836956 RepID=A0AAD9EL69_9PEZI|nr:hypothetical protein CCHR01_08719 [Colletotrichum chrysophilum]